MHQNRASLFASDFCRRRGYRREFRSEDHFYQFASQKKSRFASDFLRRGNRASWGLKKSRDFSASGNNRSRNRRESRDFGALSTGVCWTFQGWWPYACDAGESNTCPQRQHPQQDAPPFVVACFPSPGLGVGACPLSTMPTMATSSTRCTVVSCPLLSFFLSFSLFISPSLFVPSLSPWSWTSSLQNWRALPCAAANATNSQSPFDSDETVEVQTGCPLASNSPFSNPKRHRGRAWGL